MNSKKLLLGAAVSAVLLFAAPMASACVLSAWSTTNGTPVAGDPVNESIARYSGECAMQADSVGDFVEDNTPNGEAAYNARFYYYTGNRTGGAANIFEAQSASGSTNLPIRVQHDGTSLIFSTNGSATTRTVAVTDDRWYSIELAWAAGAGDGSLDIIVTGAGSLTPLNTPSITGVNNGSDTIENARLGLVAGSGTGAVNFDAFDSRRTTTPGRLCVGDAFPDGTRSVQDIGAIIGEINVTSLSAGQADVTEEGQVNVFDLAALILIINGTPACP